LQTAAAVSMLAPVVLLTHERLRQPCAFPKNWQRAVPAPLVAVLFPEHLPLRPHDAGLVVATHGVAGSGSIAPAGISVQRPIDPATRQDSQVPEHAELQQTPGLPCAR
jgi:hypothetical protein